MCVRARARVCVCVCLRACLRLRVNGELDRINLGIILVLKSSTTTTWGPSTCTHGTAASGFFPLISAPDLAGDLFCDGRDVAKTHSSVKAITLSLIAHYLPSGLKAGVVNEVGVVVR